MSHILIRNTKIVVGDSVIEASILIEDGKIAAISKSFPESTTGSVDKIVDARGKLAIPGGIDIHAHIYDPDYTHHEDWRSGSLAAAYGGITTVFDMPLRMFVDTPEKLVRKVEEGKRNSYVNFGVHAGMINEDNLEMIPELAKNGVIGFKVFTLKPWGAGDHTLLRIMDLVRSVGGLVMVHAEDDALISRGIEKNKNRHDPLAHHEARSDLAEASAVAKVGFYAIETRARTHIVHLTSALGAEAVGYLKEKGAQLTAETCPQYLYFTRDDVRRLGNYLKCAPSIKTHSDVEALWRGVSSGVIDAIASDHAPAPREEKEVDVWEAWGGLPVIELIIPFMYTLGVKQGRISLQRFIEVTSSNPARITMLYPRKGVLAPGSDADIAIIDPDLCMRVTPGILHHKVDWTPWEGAELCGWPIHVIVNGTVVIEDRELVGKPGTGRFVGEYYRERKL